MRLSNAVGSRKRGSARPPAEEAAASTLGLTDDALSHRWPKCPGTASRSGLRDAAPHTACGVCARVGYFPCMSRPTLVGMLALSSLIGCNRPDGTEPPPDGWANNAPTVVESGVDREDTQLLSVRQGALQTWVQVPDVGAEVGDYVLLGRGTARHDVEIPELGQQAREVVDIAHAQIVDEQTAHLVVSTRSPQDAVSIGTIYAELDQRADKTVVVYGTVVKATSAVGSVWVHLQDGTGDAASGTHDLTIQAQQAVSRGQRVAFRGVLRKDVALGFGYHYDALVEDAIRVE